MKKVIYIDFSKIDTIDEFYEQLSGKIYLPKHFGKNLDALNDVFTGYIKLPIHIEFVNMTLSQLDSFENLLELMENTANEIDGFSFTYFLEIYDSEEECD